MSYINFKPEAFSYLNITRIGSELDQDGSESGFSCLEITSRFSYSLAAFPDNWGKLYCELLPFDTQHPMNLAAVPSVQLNYKYNLEYLDFIENELLYTTEL